MKEWLKLLQMALSLHSIIIVQFIEIKCILYFTGPQSINRTPKLSKKRDIKSKTPSRDDVLCSQHFDSQTVVGWDCNSPGSVKSLTEKKSM